MILKEKKYLKQLTFWVAAWEEVLKPFNGTYDVTAPAYSKVSMKISYLSTTQIKLETFLVNAFNPNGIVSDSLLYKAPLTIKVYN